MLTDRELQTLRNMGNEAEEAADEIVRLRAALAATPPQAQQADAAAMWKALHAAEAAFAVLSNSLLLKEAIDALRERLAATPAAPEPLTDEQKGNEWRRLLPLSERFTSADWFEAGACFAEQHHGIGQRAAPPAPAPQPVQDLPPLPDVELAEIRNDKLSRSALSETGVAYWGSNWREVRKLYTADQMHAYARAALAATPAPAPLRATVERVVSSYVESPMLVDELCHALAATPAPAPAAPLRDAQEQPFEDWWEREGQFCRAGGGAYEKTFAWNAWCAALAATSAPAPQWTPEAAARTLALAEELRDKIKTKPDDEAGQGKEASNG